MLLMSVSIVQSVIVIVILAVMVVLLLGINHLFSGTFNSDTDDADQLRKDVDDSPEVITDKSIFHGLVEKRLQQNADPKAGHGVLGHKSVS